jgi:ABC-type nitrate/sulfonate/bicarbonate transport system substrate-binding protein
MVDLKLGTVAIDFAAGQGPAALDQPMTTGLVVQSWAQSNGAEITKIVTAFNNAVEFMKNPANRAKVMGVARTHLAGTNDATLTTLLDQLTPLLSTTYTENDNKNVMEVLTQSNLLNSPIPYDQMVTSETPN